MRNISILGTTSDAGKSTLTFIIGRILQNFGFSAAPFKAQNVSNNAKVADDGSEISIAQYFQAEVLGVPTSYHINPVLLKSGRASSASLIVEGKVVADRDVREYYRELDSLKPAVKRAFNYLNDKYDIVVAEGAGSPVELNLMDKDLANIFIADEFDTGVILVADIEKGGVFASIYGVYHLLPEKIRNNIIGVIVNKFRGDMTLFDEGIEIIEKRFGIPVLGVLPYIPLNLGFEDSQSLMNYAHKAKSDAKRIAVIAYPTMSNYNDLEPLIADENISLEFVKGNIPLNSFDEIILPGSKLVIKDLHWLKSTGLFQQLREISVPITGICGGYQMMFKYIDDCVGIETNPPAVEEALGFIDDTVVFRKEKILKKDTYEIFGKKVKGFEMHHGISEKYPISFDNGKIRGTFVHSLFDDEKFEKYKKKTVDKFVETMTGYINTDLIYNYVR
jgi:adenosylcobyric acid synthase